MGLWLNLVLRGMGQVVRLCWVPVLRDAEAPCSHLSVPEPTTSRTNLTG